VDFGAKEAPGLAYSFSQGIGRDDSIPGHLLNCSVMNDEHPRYFYVIYRGWAIEAADWNSGY
jgi:hypothetical protein